MSDKKHIDRLFQERLKDLDVTPNPRVWSGIETKLKEQKKTKRVIPIWWRASGIAALLLLFLALGNFVFNETITQYNIPNTIVDTPSSESTNPKSETTIGSTKNTDTTVSETQYQKEDSTHIITKNETQIANQTKKESVSNPSKKATQYNVNDSGLVSNKTNKSSKTEATLPYNTVAAKEHETSETPQKAKSSEILLNESEFLQKNSRSASNDKEKSTGVIPNKNSPLDSLSIEAAIAATKVVPKTDQKTKKWAVQPNIAPVYYSSTGKGSHLDDQFVNNSKSGEINTSYGVAVGYALNNKFKIRSGVNNLKLSFNTNDVILLETLGYANTGMPSLKNIAATNQTENLSFFSSSKVENLQSSSFINSNENSSDINQNISYFEVPLELEYSILNKRIGINLIGGFSTFILEGNRIYSEGNNSRTYIGEATNINDVSFSTNFGIGFDYNFSDRFNINLEPTFKYQLNAFNNISGSFNPYIIGVYTGFSYKF
ncbi:hypothetical protein [Formosa sp. PL04]|uniref:hypothetical protein n=1 Tax=Formosa sp. PL04 TaxID=3081755 RepID=UPI0029818E9A|nr:hypothetical protein [Formosa sp. PL04]MDW5289046.1 hypothetical protein [Formosa sp. PL04]